MKKINSLILLVCLLLLTNFGYSIKLFGHPFRLGLGYTFDTGVHIRLGKFELQSIFGRDFNICGLRFYALERNFNIKSHQFNFYVGAEPNVVLSELLSYGYTIGAFSGVDKKIYKGLHISLDIGLYYVYLKGPRGWGDIGSIASAINLKLTYFIRGGKNK